MCVRKHDSLGVTGRRCDGRMLQEGVRTLGVVGEVSIGSLCHPLRVVVYKLESGRAGHNVKQKCTFARKPASGRGDGWMG